MKLMTFVNVPVGDSVRLTDCVQRLLFTIIVLDELPPVSFTMMSAVVRGK